MKQRFRFDRQCGLMVPCDNEIARLARPRMFTCGSAVFAGGRQEAYSIDPYVASVKLLIQDGTAGTQAVTDRSSFASSATMGTAQIWASDQQVFGANTMKCTQIMPGSCAFTGNETRFGLLNNRAYTLEMWFRWSSLGNAAPSAAFCNWTAPNSSSIFGMTMTGNAGSWEHRNAGGVTAIGSLTANAWHFIQVVCTTTPTLSFYNDGILVNSFSASSLNTNGTWTFNWGSIGSTNATASTYWIGPTRLTMDVNRPVAVPTALFPL